jgi:hypothetical protein
VIPQHLNNLNNRRNPGMLCQGIVNIVVGIGPRSQLEVECPRFNPLRAATGYIRSGVQGHKGKKITKLAIKRKSQ